MKTQDEINEIRHADERKLKTVKDVVDSMIGRKTDEINKKAQKVKDKIQELIDKKHGIFDQPYSKAYVLDMAKKALREKKKEWFLDGVLVPHMKECQAHASPPLTEAIMKINMGSPQRVWRMLYSLITEKDLEEAVAMLPDIGMSVAEKEVEIGKIDAEIKALQEQIKKEFEGGL